MPRLIVGGNEKKSPGFETFLKTTGYDLLGGRENARRAGRNRLSSERSRTRGIFSHCRQQSALASLTPIDRQHKREKANLTKRRKPGRGSTATLRSPA